MDIDKLLAGIAQKLERLRGSVADVRKTETYGDEPISPKKETSFAIDENIKTMKAIAENPESMWQSREAVFIKQARLMENYETEYSQTPAFHCYYPTYRDMNDSQLMYYFSWRTKLRRGEYTKIGTSYVFVYIYELLSLIGCNGAEDGFEKLRQLQKHIKEDSYDPDIILYHLEKWILDFAVYYDLPASFLQGSYDERPEAALAALQKWENSAVDEIFSALCILSSYNVSKSRFFAAYPEDYKTVLVGTYSAMCRYCEKNRKTSYFDRLFGKRTVFPYRIFEAAVFRPDHRKEYEYNVNPVHSYKTTSTGAWYSYRLYLPGGKNKALGKLLKAVDRIMRLEYGFAYPLSEDDTTKLLTSIIEEQINALREEKEKKKKTEIRIDMSLLSGIRRSADITRDRLIVEEELEEDEPAISASAKEEPEGFSKEECGLMSVLLKGEKYRGMTPVSLLCDSINEKLFDRFSDTVIDFEGDEPRIIEDYREELEEMFI
ncbi:MAG: hypothetical protein E7647_03295 [Ruminococcaceae bacterium]|nr:hypothetical protein [Oscillospiraceae bacterium]